MFVAEPHFESTLAPLAQPNQWGTRSTPEMRIQVIHRIRRRGVRALHVRAGAVGLGIGSALISGPDQPLEELAARARALREAWDEAVG